MSHKPPLAPLPDTDDPYLLLDVQPGVSVEQLRRAYLRRVKVYKPDRHPAEFRRIREAYDRLREQEAWFHAWRRAGEVVRQAVEEDAQRSGGDGEAAAEGGAEAGERVATTDDEPDDRDDRELDLDGSAWETTATVVRPPRPEDNAAAQLGRLIEAVHAELAAGRAEEAADQLLTLHAAELSSQPAFAALLLEVCCAAVWEAPSRFETLMTRFSDLVSSHDTEFRDGALLHRRILLDELAAWRQAVSDWPELRRFVAYGASLRAAAEAELGLCLGKRASADPAGLLATLQRAGRIAPGIVALYVGMAESWAKRFALPRAARPKRAPTVDQAAEAIAVTLRTHRTVRWAQWRPLVAVVVTSVLLLLSPSPLFELVVIGMFVALWAWQAWARDPADALYLRVVQPTAAIWLWATGASPDELASALGPRLPAKGSWPAFFHPVDPSVYPDLMGNDLTLLAFSVTAPMIPGRRGPERYGVA